MYDINPNKSGMSEWGVGKLEDQVINPSIFVDALNHKAANDNSDKQARAKKLAEARQRTTDLANNNIGEVHPSDLIPLQKDMLNYRDSVQKAYIEGGGDISVENEAKLNQQFNVINQNALASKNRKDAEDSIIGEMNKNKNDYRDAEHLSAHDNYAKSSYNETTGKYDFAPRVSGSKIYNIKKELIDPAADQLRQEADARMKAGITTWKSPNAYITASQAAENPNALKELHGQFADNPTDLPIVLQSTYGEPKDAYGNDNPSFIANPAQRAEKINSIKSADDLDQNDAKAILGTKFMNDFIVDKKPIPHAPNQTGNNKPPPQVSGVYTKGKDGKDSFQFEYTNQTDNPYISIPSPKGGAIEVKPYKVNFDGANTKLEVLTKPTTEDTFDPAGNKNGTRKVEGKPMFLDYTSVSEQMNNKFGIDNVYSLKNPETTPKHVRVKRVDISHSNTEKESHPLPKGKTATVIQNGHKYTWSTLTGQYE